MTNDTTAAMQTRQAGGPGRKPLYKDMSVQVFAGMVIGAIVGYL